MLPRLYSTGDTGVRIGTGVPALLLNPILLTLRNDEGTVGEGGKCDASNLLAFASGEAAPFLDESDPATDRRMLENDTATEDRRLAVLVGLSGGFNSSPFSDVC